MLWIIKPWNFLIRQPISGKRGRWPIECDRLILMNFLARLALVGPGKILRRAIEEDRLFSMLFWGPPGTGKTTLAKIIARRSRSKFVPYSAVTVGVKEIKEVAARAKRNLHIPEREQFCFLTRFIDSTDLNRTIYFPMLKVDCYLNWGYN